MRFALVFLLALTGCAAVIPVPPPSMALNCPPLVSYAMLEEAALGAEITKDGPEAQRWIEDYLKLRSACKQR